MQTTYLLLAGVAGLVLATQAEMLGQPSGAEREAEVASIVDGATGLDPGESGGTSGAVNRTTAESIVRGGLV